MSSTKVAVASETTGDKYPRFFKMGETHEAVVNLVDPQGRVFGPTLVHLFTSQNLGQVDQVHSTHEGSHDIVDLNVASLEHGVDPM